MPSYDYRCTACHEVFEISHDMNSDRTGAKPLDCPLVADGVETECIGSLKRAYLSAPPMRLDGTGWTKKPNQT